MSTRFSPPEPAGLEDHDIRRMLRSMPNRSCPPALRMNLQVLASKESARRKTRRTVLDVCRSVWGDLRLCVHNAMRPLAIPTAGGFVSALILFGMLTPVLTIPGAAIAASGNDIPTGLYTDASVKNFIPLSFPDREILVELTVDGNGRIVDYRFTDERMMKCQTLRRSVERSLLFSQFKPATSFGQPKTGKLRLSFRSSSIDIQG